LIIQFAMPNKIFMLLNLKCIIICIMRKKCMFEFSILKVKSVSLFHCYLFYLQSNLFVVCKRMIHPKKLKLLGFLFSTFWVSRKNKFMLSCVRVHFMKNASLKLKNRIRIFGFFSSGFFYWETPVFCKPGKVQKNGCLKPV
jgi:hypothetical protein